MDVRQNPKKQHEKNRFIKSAYVTLTKSRSAKVKKIRAIFMALKKIFSLLFSDYRMYIHDTVSPLKSVFNCSRYFFVSEV